jgi:hypothetical protein
VGASKYVQIVFCEKGELITILWFQNNKVLFLQDTNARLSFPMHFIAQLEGRLYCSDPFQVAQTIPYLTIQVKAQAVIPKLTAGSAIFLRDLNCTRGNFQIKFFSFSFNSPW